MSIKALFGAPTPTRVASWLLFGAGAAAAIASRFVEAGDWWLGVGLVAIGLSMVADALLPGGSDLSLEQQTMVRQIGIPRPDMAHKGLSLILGIPLVGFGLYLLFG